MHRPPRSRARTDYAFQRAYKACIPCRQRKVKCVVDNDPQRPCKRCRRMDLECRFSAKQPWSRRQIDAEDRNGTITDDQGQLRGRDEAPVFVAAAVADRENEKTPSTSISAGLEDGGCISTTVLQKQVASANDALDILFDAAAHTQLDAHVRVRQNVTETVSPFDVRSEDNVLKIWEGCRFVKMGWFTAEEALLYTDWFFHNLAPIMTPILTDFFTSHNTHYWLITQEPVLCCTILMISARYHTLPGPCGGSRGFYIHNRLWQHCQHLILRIMLGQEKLSKAKTRHISSVEALLLLSEWYPLALHFPHETDGWDSDWMLTTHTMRDPPPDTKESLMQDRWREDVVEPTRRSDRMSWMLISSALALAHELGVFDSREQTSTTRGQGVMAGPDVEDYLRDMELRRQRLPSLLFVTVNLLASRIGCTSIMPELSKQSSCDRLLTIDPEWANFMSSWIELTKLTRSLRDSFFDATKYETWRADFGSLEQWKAQLAAWKQRHPDVKTSRYDNILLIEYQNLRVFVNSLGVQSIVERVLSETLPQGTIDATFVSQARELNMSRNEFDFIEEVIDGACVILARVVSLSNPRCLPMMLLSRVISSSIFLLKALALGVRKTKLQDSLHLLDEAVAALLSNPLDDIHLVSRYATLLKTHVSRLRQTFASSRREEIAKSGSEQDEARGMGVNEPEQPCPTDVAWNSDAMDWSGQEDLGGLLSLPLDPLMAPFGPWYGPEADLGLDLDCLDLGFIWNLPP
ncbi:hypothetical protein BDW69DRAFT_205481 [Aspergillus filifer]